MQTNLTEKWIVCRICLKHPKEPMQMIFDKNEEKDLTRMILECGGVPIKKFDHYPDKICDKCLKYLRVAYKFRITCQRSHKHLSRFIAPVEVDKSGGESDGGVPNITVEFNEQGEMALKLEPKVELDIKQEYNEDDNEDGGVLEVYMPMEEGEESFEGLDDDVETPAAEEPDELEYLEEFVDEIPTSDEEYVPHAKKSPPKKSLKGRILRQAAARKKSNSQRPTTSQKAPAKTTKLTKATAIKKEPKSKCSKEKLYICDVCGNIYQTQGRLTEHIKLHQGIKPHECEICGHAFSQVQQLARHMNTHTGNRPYKCNYCPAAFADLSTRNKHHRIHTNERPYVCDVCGKAFTYTNTLKFHKMIHTGEKPFVCEICGKGFQQSYKLRNHKLTHEKRGIKLEKLVVESVPTYQEVTVATAQILEI